jgi:sulfoxide reductase heme-binding subunit YedZ
LNLIWPWQDRNRKFSWLKASTLALMFVPALYVTHQYMSGEFGRFPLAGWTYWSGVWSTAVLLLALAVTPAAKTFRWNQLVIVRRMIGVTALIYTIGHIIIYFALRFWDFASIATEMVTRVSLIVATLSTIGLIALGATSLDAAIRRMGADKWNRLHNTVYVLTGLALFHYLLSPGIYATQYSMSGMFVWFMVWRALDRRGLGTNVGVLTALTVACALFTAFLEATWIWVYQGFEPLGTLAGNFSTDIGLPASWQVLVLGLLIVAAVFVEQTLRPRTVALDARKSG